MRQLQLSQFVTSVDPGRRPQVMKIEPSVTGGKWAVVGGLLTKALTVTCANVKRWYGIWTVSAILYCYEEVMKRNRSLSFDTADDLIMCGAVALTEQTFTPERQRYQVYRAIASLLGYHVRTPLPAVLEAGVKAQWPNQSDVKELVASPRPSRIRNSQEDPLQRGIQALDAGRIVLEKAVELVSSIVDRQKLDDLPWEPRPDPAWPSAQKSEDDEVWVNDASLEALVDEFETYHGVTHNGRAPENVGGTDDISVTIEGALRELLKDSCILEKAQAEMDSVVGRERLVNESDLPNLPYLNAIVDDKRLSLLVRVSK
ncbi:hypothetical protein R1sor_009402 [Riccia sorocarpa]|uniref:Uncharacterized protein n=1 Tax=Riccia sorocarpa TaxID=122646 RepID=A0ABD3HWK4_9MARC